MATVNFYKQFDMYNPPSVWTGYLTDATSSYIRIHNVYLSGGPIYSREGIYYGKSFKYKSGEVASGTLTGYQNSTNNSVDYLYTGLSLSAKTAQKYINSNDVYNLSKLALKGNDSIYGSYSNDTLLGFKGNDDIVGNEGNDYLYGNEGNDYLYGYGGNDVLIGGSGKDGFVFENLQGGVDIVYDFNKKDDKIWFSKIGFSAFATNAVGSAIKPNQFASSTFAINGLDADDRVIHNTTSGALYYDSDGNGPNAAIQIATVGIVLSSTNIYIF